MRFEVSLITILLSLAGHLPARSFPNHHRRHRHKLGQNDGFSGECAEEFCRIQQPVKRPFLKAPIVCAVENSLPFLARGNVARVDRAHCRDGMYGEGSCYHYVFNGKAALVRMSQPVIPRLGAPFSFNETVYFEVTVGEEGVGLEGTVAIGLVSNHHKPTLLPGLARGSWALHSDDGRCYTLDQYKYCTEPLKGGDVVGVGVESYSKRMYFTKNGVHQGVPFAFGDFSCAEEDLDFSCAEEDLHLAIGMTRGDTKIFVNVGPYFKFDPKMPLNANGKANQVFGRFDINGDNFLDFMELKSVIRATSPNPKESFTYNNYVRFCQLTSANPKNGMSPNAFYMLFEMNFGNIDDDYAVLTQNTTREILRPVSSAALTVAKNTVDFANGFGDDYQINIDGGWSDWGECTKVCGYQGIRKRTCTEPAPQGNGFPCQGESVQPCNRHRCYDGASWSDWTPCSTTCGAGVQFRTCLTDSLSICEGEAVRICKNRYPCRPNDYTHIEEMLPKPSRRSPRSRVPININNSR